MMFTTRISPLQIDRLRIEAEYYDPEKLSRLSWLERWRGRSLPLDGLCEFITDGTHVTPTYVADGIRFLSSKNILDGYVDFDDTKFISREEHGSLGRAKCNPAVGDILLSKNGKIGTAAVYLAGHPPCSLFVSVALLKYSGTLDRDYVVAFLNSAGGWHQFTRSAKTGVITNLHLEEIREINVPEPSVDAQRYIGDKVRQAERLRERARRYEAEFREAVTVTTTSKSATSAKTSRVAAGELGRNLNPGAHTPERRAVRAAVRAAGGRTLEELADVESPTIDTYAADATYVGLAAIDSATCRLQPSTAAAEAVAGTARLLREGPAISRLRPYLNKVTYIPPTIAGGIGSTELLLIRPKPGVDGWFLYGVLKLDSSVRQLNPVATGSTHPRVDREDVLELLLPWTEDQAGLGAKLRTAQGCYVVSAALTSTATKLVERLIDGRITETDLVTAQKALEAGDRSSDRAILQGLRQSDAPDAKPLIPDLDGLYALIDEPDGEKD
ncbi:hypothetical protein ACU4HD_19545 [Cupriavidus basilensis]